MFWYSRCSAYLIKSVNIVALTGFMIQIKLALSKWKAQNGDITMKEACSDEWFFLIRPVRKKAITFHKTLFKSFCCAPSRIFRTWPQVHTFYESHSALDNLTSSWFIPAVIPSGALRWGAIVIRNTPRS